MSLAQRRRLGEDGLVIAMDPDTGHLLKYEEKSLLFKKPTKWQTSIDISLFNERQNIQVL